MSSYNGYHSEGAPSSKRSSRKSRRPVYEERIIESKQSRNQPPLQQALVRRPRSNSSSSIEEIDREFDPESGTYTQRRSVIKDRYGDRYGPPRPRSEAGYTGRGRPGARRKYSYDSYDSYADSESSRSRSRPRHRSKSRGERALEAVGLGGAVGAVAERFRSMSRKRASSRGKSRDSSADSYTYYSRSRSRGARARSASRGRGSSRSPSRKQKYEDAAKAALAAAAIEAWRARKEVPVDAGKRIITAALASAGIDAAVQREDRHGNRNAIMSAIGGIATNRLINGQGRSRSRPGKRDSGTAGAAASAAALAAIAGKAIKDQHDRSRSKSQARMRDDSSDDGGRYSPSRRNRKSLSEHLYKPTDTVLDKLGYGESSYHHSKYAKDKYGRRHYSDDEDNYDDGPRLRGGGGDASDSDDCSTDSYSSDEEEKKIKKGRTKSLVTGGLAAVATVHAAHSVYNSVEAREKRHRKVMEGKMSPEEARRLKTRAALQDVAAVGIAALGIKGAVSEWKEVREHRHEIANRRLRLDEMREHRQKKLEQGEWDHDTWRRKREEHFGSGSVGGRGSSQPASRSRQEAIEYRGRDSDDRGSHRRGRSSRRYADDYDDYDDDYYDDYRDKPRSRRSYRRSLPPESSGRRKRRNNDDIWEPVRGGPELSAGLTATQAAIKI